MAFNNTPPFFNPGSNMDYAIRNPNVANAMIEDMEAQIRYLRQVSGIQNQNQNSAPNPGPIPIPNPNMDLNICHRLYDDHFSKDFRIMVGGQEFWVHKCFLVASCPQLAPLIGPGNHSGGFLSIEGYTPKTIEEFIRFLYRGDITEESARNPETLAGLIKFGHKFQMDQLVDYSVKLVGVNNQLFDTHGQRILIRTAGKLRSAKILDPILGFFETESFTTNEPANFQNQNQTQNQNFTSPHTIQIRPFSSFASSPSSAQFEFGFGGNSNPPAFGFTFSAPTSTANTTFSPNNNTFSTNNNTFGTTTTTPGNTPGNPGGPGSLFGGGTRTRTTRATRNGHGDMGPFVGANTRTRTSFIDQGNRGWPI